MKVVYCENCGTALKITRRALPKYARIIDVVEYHECPDEPVPIDFEPSDIPTFSLNDSGEKHDKFVQNLNRLSPKTILGNIGSTDFRDRRFTKDLEKDESDTIKTSAPVNTLKMLEDHRPSLPAHDVSEEPESED